MLDIYVILGKKKWKFEKVAETRKKHGLIKIKNSIKKHWFPFVVQHTVAQSAQ